jgi:2-iminobutanoate/2-iminopropanoate deaminase
MNVDEQDIGHFELINPPGLAPPVGPYSQAARVGDLLFCSGQLALDPETSRPLSELDIAEQTRMALESLDRVLEGSGTSRDRVLRTTVYLASLEDYEGMNGVYRRFFDGHLPARATLAVAGLVGGLRVEIDAVAVVPPPR